MQIFHGGCHGCTQQDKFGVGYCVGCQYHDPNWDLPDLSDCSNDIGSNKIIDCTVADYEGKVTSGENHDYSQSVELLEIHRQLLSAASDIMRIINKEV